MNINELEEKIRDEIEIQLWHLGSDNNDSVFPNFDLNSHELPYGVQRLDQDIVVETKARTKDDRIILAKIKIELMVD